MALKNTKEKIKNKLQSKKKKEEAAKERERKLTRKIGLGIAATSGYLAKKGTEGILDDIPKKTSKRTLDVDTSPAGKLVKRTGPKPKKVAQMASRVKYKLQQIGKKAGKKLKKPSTKIGLALAGATGLGTLRDTSKKNFKSMKEAKEARDKKKKK